MKLGIVNRPVRLGLPAGETQLKRILQNMETTLGRAAAYGIKDDIEARYFASEGVELDFVGSYYRRGYIAGTTPAALPGWTFSRALAAFALNASGGLDAFASGAPRINNLGLLVEPARTNLVLQSQTFDAANWIKDSNGAGVLPVVTPNAALAPDGTMTADQVQLSLGGGSAGSDWSVLTPNVGIPVVDGQPYWGSVYVKGVPGQSIALRHAGGGDYSYHTFSGGWERIETGETASGTSAVFEIGLRGARPVSPAVTFDIWGAQLEHGAYPTSYIPTTDVAVERPADAPLLPGLNLQNGCTVLIDFAFIGAGSMTDPGGRVAMALSGDSNSNRALLFNTADGIRLSAEVVAVNTIELDTYGAAGVDQVQRVAFRIAPDNSRIARNGELEMIDNSGAPPANLTRLGLGMYPWNDAHGGVVIRRVVIIPSPVSDSQLKVMTGGSALPKAAKRWVQVNPAGGFTKRDSARTFTMGGWQYMANGFIDGGVPIKDLRRSRDGISGWQVVNASPPYEDWSTVVAVGNVIYAFKTAMWRSLDGGATWTKIINTLPFVMDTDSPALVIDGVLCVFPGTGLGGDATNGEWQFNPGDGSWTQTWVATWGPRGIPVVSDKPLDGYVYLYGGLDLTTPSVPPSVAYPDRTTLNDLWRRAVGSTTWTLCVAEMPFSPRLWPTLTLFEGALHLVGGFDPFADPTTNFDNTFVTRDGRIWSLLPVAGTFSERHAAIAYVKEGRFLLTAGKANREPADGVLDDTWELQSA